MNLQNLSPFEAGITITTDKFGYENILVVTKGTFNIKEDGTCEISTKQQPLVNEDEYFGEPGLSSLRYESDYSFFKPKTDVIVNGYAFAPGGRPAKNVDVTLKFRQINKTIKVFGERTWFRTLLGGFKAKDPIPFVTMPVTYERAFGGCDQSHKDEKKHAFETSNLVGVGFHKYIDKRIVGKQLPNLEDPKNLIKNPRDKPNPVGFGFISRNWQPRVSYTGTYDQNWLDERYPFLPLDFDNRYFQGAPADQMCEYLKGGEIVKLYNFTSDGYLEFRLPIVDIPIMLIYISGKPYRNLKPVCDTLIFEPDLRRFIMVWRASIRLHCKLTIIKEIWVGKPSRARMIALETGKAYISQKDLGLYSLEEE